MMYVVAAYAITIVLVAGYAASVFSRRRAAARAALRQQAPREAP